MDSINDRLQIIVNEFFDGNKAQFAKAVNIPPTSISNYFNEKRQSKPSSEMLCKILNVVDKLSSDWLLLGKGPMLKSSIGNQDEVKVVQPSNVMMVPLVSQYAHAGYMSGFADSEYMDSLPKVPFPMDEEHHGEYVCFEVRGDSMDDGMRHSYAQGDIVLCRNVDKLYWMKKLHYNAWNAFVIVHKEGIVLKQIVAHDVERGIITVHSFNPYYEDFDIDLRDVYQILNVVKTQRNG